MRSNGHTDGDSVVATQKTDAEGRFCFGDVSAGDWLVDYGDGSLGVVSRKVFDQTYEIVS